MDRQRYLTCPPDEEEDDQENPFLCLPEYRYSQVTFKTFSEDEIRSQAGKEVLLREAKEEVNHERNLGQLKIQEDDLKANLVESGTDGPNVRQSRRHQGQVQSRGVSSIPGPSQSIDRRSPGGIGHDGGQSSDWDSSDDAALDRRRRKGNREERSTVGETQEVPFLFEPPPPAQPLRRHSSSSEGSGVNPDPRVRFGEYSGAIVVTEDEEEASSPLKPSTITKRGGSPAKEPGAGSERGAVQSKVLKRPRTNSILTREGRFPG